MRILTEQEVIDVLVGCTILGTGGGGSLEEGILSVNKAFKDGKTFKLLDFSEIDEHKYYINPYFCGCIRPDSKNKDAVKPSHTHLVSAVITLEEYMKINFHGIVSIEYGGGNTAHAMVTAAYLDKYIVDADAAGRAVPELQFSTYFITNQPIYPFSISTAYDDKVIVPFAADDERAEALSRWMAVGSGGFVGMADHPIIGTKLLHSVIPNALSYAETIGKARRLAVDEGKNPISAILKAGKGKLLFEGEVASETCWEIKEGFTIGTVHLTDRRGETFKIWYKNENMIAWKNDQICLTCPDLICTVNTETGYPITNPNCKAGDKISVLAFESHPLWKSEKGLSILNPRFFGFDIDFKFIEKDDD